MSRVNLVQLAVLLIGVLASAVTVVWLKNQSRQLFVELQQVRAERELAGMEWGRLQLELANVGNLEDVMRISSRRLHMHEPEPDNIVVID